ncbi:MAG TPA: hypothetical protein DCE41_04075 [Cytophagales bacterium]|nr:hypothetical protein [Cytophagales bacterium]HAA23452.1 hypothetical protein [Cytophagales bacterium]HAP62813.1 hypothetical protein [Cytophagales bacterium]
MKRVSILLSLILMCFKLQAQDSLVSMAGVARATPGAILLRWAPTSAESWMNHNQYGYRVEKVVVEKDSALLAFFPTPESLGPDTLRPAPLAQWEGLALSSKYGAIAAQALYGDSFEVDFGEGDTNLFTVYQKAQEQELRFGLHLLAADLDAEVAQKSGLAFQDEGVVDGERYLYRVISNVPRELGGGDTLLFYLGTQDASPLPVAPEVLLQQGAGTVSVTWNTRLVEEYSGYFVERSLDTLKWERVYENPITNLVSENPDSPYNFQTVIDSANANAQLRYYRIVGYTPFGELGPPSPWAKIQVGGELLTRIPILKAQSRDNETVEVAWEYLQPQQNISVQIERGRTNEGPFEVISPSLTLQDTVYKDIQPRGTNYYRLVIANPYDQEWASPPVLVQLVDSIPPVVPTGLSGEVSADGTVSLSWAPNPDSDIEGYRIFRANYRSEEPFQITGDPVAGTAYVDHISVETLTEQVHYQLMAVDWRGNASPLSEMITLERPDKLAPKAPQVHFYRAEDYGIDLAWYPSPSSDAQQVVIFRRAADEAGWRSVAAFSNVDTAWTDSLVVPDMAYRYALVAIDDVGNESDRSRFVQVRAKQGQRRVEPKLFVEVDREGRRIRLGWPPSPGGLAEVRIYRADGENPMIQLITVRGSQSGFVDRRVVPNTDYTYTIQWVYQDGTKSKFSEYYPVSY